MPYIPRVDVPGAYYHVMARGNNREALFLTDSDRSKYIYWLAKLLPLHQFEAHAFCLMTNHIHLLLRSSGGSLARFMERLHMLYAIRFNRLNGRVGHLFEKRYCAKIVSSEAHLFHVCRYIHLNPVRAGMVQRPEEYPWSSMRAYLNSADFPFVEKNVMLAWFGHDKSEFHMQTVTGSFSEEDRRGWPADANWYVSNTGRRTIGDRACSALCDSTPERSVEEVARCFNMKVNNLTSAWKDKRFGRARLTALWVLRQKTTLTLAEIGKLLGYRSVKGVSNMLQIAEARRNRESDLRSKMDMVIQRLRDDVEDVE